MKKTSVLMFVVGVLAVSMLSGCASVDGLYRMANTSHDAGSCAGFKGRARDFVEGSLNLKPIQSYEEGAVEVAQYEKGNFGAVFVYENGKTAKYFCGSSMFAASLARKYTEELTERKSGSDHQGKGVAAAEMMDRFRRAAEAGNGALNP